MKIAFQTSKVVPQSVLTDVNPLQTMPQALGDGDLAILHEQAKHYGDLARGRSGQCPEDRGGAVSRR